FLSGIYFQAIAKPFFVPLPDSWYKEGKYGFLWPKDIPAIHRTIDELISLRNAGYPIHNFAMQLVIFKTYFARPDIRARKAACYAGDYVINVNPSGDISLCCFMKPVGNIKKDDIGKLWFSEQSAEMRQKMHNCTINCNNMVNCFFKEGEEEKS
ncbi:MAG: SPASM domain-containing protein, partial [Candidatus Omnitrophica bacterium]|nr:SPASM domain-containing protein [Candidatus Omnitrophota bacterium]